MTCENALQQLPLLLYGELSFEDEEAVHQHLGMCSSCQAEFVETTTLHQGLDEAEADVDPVLLANCRRNLRVSVHALAEKSQAAPWFTRWFTWELFGKPVSALTLIAMGFFGGRMIPSLEQSGPVASRVSFVEPRDSGKVQIVLEETRQRVLSGDMEDESIRSLLLRAARESADPGVRVGTMDMLKQQPESADVRRALLHALRSDPNAGVRLKALEALRSSADDQDTRRVLAEVLLKDDNPGVRTQVVDLLTNQAEPEPEMVGLLQEIMSREDNEYVRRKVQRALNDMNASVEIF